MRRRDRWSLDHLFVDQDAIPTFVEVKRSSDTRLRRQVVGQMLDYAANASAYWDAGRLRSSFESRFDSSEAADDELAAFVEDDLEPDGVLGYGRRQLEGAAPAAGLRGGPHPGGAAEHRRVPQRAAGADRGHRRRGQAVRGARRGPGQHRPAGHRRNRDGPPCQARRRRRPSTARAPRSSSTPRRATSNPPELAERVLALYEHAKAHGSRQTFGRGKSRTRPRGWARTTTPRSRTRSR